MPSMNPTYWNEPIAYYWARIGKCENPTCGAEIPLLKQLYLIKKGSDSIYLEPIIRDKTISFEIPSFGIKFQYWEPNAIVETVCSENIFWKTHHFETL